jgi:hypothetical protein
MTDVRTLLGRAAGAGATEVPDEVVAADLARGRRRLRRRAAARAGAGVAVVAVVAGGLAVVTDEGRVEPIATTVPSTGPAATGAPSGAATPHSSSPPQRFAPVRLVAYTGEQPSGYVVAYVPKGWEIQGANPFRLTIAPIGSKDRNPDGFVGKLVVMLQSADATGEPVGRQIAVGDGTGYLNDTDATADVLTFQDDKGHWVQVQVPPRLAWSDAEIGRFAAGVEVTGDAEPGRG